MKSRFEAIEAMSIADRTDCPYAKDLTIAALLRLGVEDLESMGRSLSIFMWDPDNIFLSRKQEPDPETDSADYVIRMWDFIDNGSGYDVPFTMFRMVYGLDGAGRGDLMCQGTFGVVYPR